MKVWSANGARSYNGRRRGWACLRGDYDASRWPGEDLFWRCRSNSSSCYSQKCSKPLWFERFNFNVLTFLTFLTFKFKHFAAPARTAPPPRANPGGEEECEG